MITEKNLKKYYDHSLCMSYYESTYIIGSKHQYFHLINLYLNGDGKILKKISDFKNWKGKRKREDFKNISDWNSFVKEKKFHRSVIIDTANKANECQNKIYINEDVISFITKWANGTGHGFEDIFNCILNYIKDIDKLKSKKILVYKNSCQGILDVINHLCHMNVIDKNKIIYIEPDKVYKIKSVSIHVLDMYNSEPGSNDKLNEGIKMLISKYFINKIDYLNPINCFIENVAIIKDNVELSISQRGDGFNKNDINLFCKKYNYTILRPEDINEVTLINILNNCKKFVASWGTASLKNTVYLSENCKSINILVKKDSRYHEEYILNYLTKYNEYLDSDKTNERSESLKNFYDPPRTKYQVVKDLVNIVL